jgi:hypothetical protein
MSIAWKHWLNPRRVPLWTAVALVLEISPNDLRPLRNGWMAGPGSGPLFEPLSFPSPEKRLAFDEALVLAERATTYEGPIHLQHDSANRPRHRTAQVSLREVVAFFASRRQLDIPERLLTLVPAGRAPAAARTSTGQRTKKGQLRKFL